MHCKLLLTLAALAFSLIACTPAAPPLSASENQGLVWPAPPEQARIQYLRSFSKPDDLGVAKPFWTRMRELLTGENEAHLIKPMAVVASEGRIYVADAGVKGVHRFALRDGEYELIRGVDGLLLPSVVGLALGANGDVYVSDSKLGKVFVIRSGKSHAEPLALAGELRQPTGIAYDRARHELYVVDTALHVIRIFADDGSLLRSLGRRGSGDGEFNYPTLLWRDPSGQLYVTDSLNFRVQILDSAGHKLGAFGRMGDGTGDTARHKGVATDSFGHVYVVDGLFHALQVFDQGGHFLLSVGGQGQAAGAFWLPVGIFIDQENMIYVADTYNHRVQVFRYIGGET